MHPRRFLVRLSPSSGGRAPFLHAVRAISGYLGGKAVNPKWTSRGSLEVDVFVASEGDLRTLVEALVPLAKVEFTRDLDEPPRFLPEDDLFEMARGYFNSERYWECHEVLESVWRVSNGDEKGLLQAMILVCASLVHHQKEETSVAMGVARRALPQLKWASEKYHGIDVAALRERCTRMERGDFSPFTI